MFKFLDGIFGGDTPVSEQDSYAEQFAGMERWQQMEERYRWANQAENDYMNKTGKMPPEWFESDGFTCKPFKGPGKKVLKTYEGSWQQSMDRSHTEDAMRMDHVRGGPRRRVPYL